MRPFAVADELPWPAREAARASRRLAASRDGQWLATADSALRVQTWKVAGMKMTHVFDKPEVMVPFKCDVHGWMNAYVGVLDHPYFAVTKDDGKFELKDLPAGTYTVTAWHEKLGPMTQSVTIGAKESKDVNFTFKPLATATN